MRRVIRNKTSRAFLTADGEWGIDLSSARTFLDIQSAMAACAQHNLTGAELLYIMGRELCADYDIALPIGEAGNKPV